MSQDTINRTAPKMTPQKADYQKKMREAIELMNRFESRKAIEMFRTITDTYPHEAQAWMGLAMTYYDMLKLEAAMEAFRQVEKAAGNKRLAENSACHMHLVVGNYQRGWQGYMQRNLPRLPDQVPMLTAQTEKDFTHLIILPEQGFGDMIQFSRFFLHLRQKYQTQHISFFCPTPLKKLLQPYCDSIKINLLPPPDENRKLEIPKAENQKLVYTHICSLAAMFNCSMRDVRLPNQINLAYDQQKAEKLRAKKAKKTGRPLIGFCWSGKPQYSKDYKRSCPPEKVLELINALPGCNFISLTKIDPQHQDNHKDIIQHAAINSERITRCEDFYDTATLIKACDAVITVDTACAHLAATMRKPTYLMLPYAPDWRWKLGRNDSPWYQTCKLFRQRRLGQWEHLIQALQKQITIDLQQQSQTRKTNKAKPKNRKAKQKKRS